MNSKRFLLGLVFSLLIVKFSFAQPVAEAPQQEQAPEVQPAEGEQIKDPLKEQIIYVPYEKLPQVFEKPARGVFLHYEQFQQLWDSARKNSSIELEQGPPLRSLITSIESSAEVRGWLDYSYGCTQYLSRRFRGCLFCPHQFVHGRSLGIPHFRHADSDRFYQLAVEAEVYSQGGGNCLTSVNKRICL